MARVIRTVAATPPKDSILGSLGPDRSKKKFTKGRARTTLDSAREQLTGVLKTPDLARPKHLVALYATLHEQVYEVFPDEIREPKTFLAACAAAQRLIDDAFEASPSKAIEFMRWVWQEQRTEAKRKKSRGDAPFRVGWRYQFVSRDLVTNYRVAMQSRAR